MPGAAGVAQRLLRLADAARVRPRPGRTVASSHASAPFMRARARPMVSSRRRGRPRRKATPAVTTGSRGYAERVFSTRAVRRLEKLLRSSAATVTLRIEELRGDQRQQLDRLLQRLAPYGDRVSIWLGARVRPLLTVDSSIFHLLLEDTRVSTPVTP